MNCRICNDKIEIKDFQNHLIENHNILFMQYIGIVTPINFIIKQKDSKQCQNAQKMRKRKKKTE